MDDLKQRLRAEIDAIMGPAGADYSCEPVTLYMEAADALDAKDAEIAALKAERDELLGDVKAFLPM